MSYQLFWRSPALPFTGKQNPIAVPAGQVVSNAASIRFTGKGATNYGKIEQENMMRLLENFAGPTAPDYPTVGQLWYDTQENNLKVCISTPGVGYPSTVWQQLNATQVTDVGELPPPYPELGDTWFSRTGSASGVMYAYSGIGRYPQVNWDASSYWPTAATTTLGIKRNQDTFTTVNFGEAYVHGYTGATAADVNGTILINGVSTTVPKGSIATQFPVDQGYIVWDQSGSMTSTSVAAYFVVHQTNDGARWFYDNNSVLIEFTPTAQMYVIGRITVAEQDDQSSPGVSAAVMFTSAPRLMDVMQVPATSTSGAIGGWEQIWPAVETHGGRGEYEYVYGQLMRLIGNPAMYGGSGAESRAIQNLTDFRTLDASMQKAWQAITPLDTLVASGTGVSTLNGIGSLKVEVNSQDWDKLLSACRYAVSRLELPSGMVNDLAQHPFVQDGLPADPTVVALTGVRAIPNDRRNRNRIGGLTVFSQYQESLNVLRAAIQNRYIMKGMLEASGVGNTFAPTVIATAQAAFAAPGTALTGTVTHGLSFVFTTVTPDIERFFFSGAAAQLVFAHSGTSTAADTALRTIANGFGRIRVLGDNTFVMTPAATPTSQLAQSPVPLGFANLGAVSTTLASLTSGTATIAIRATRPAYNQVNIYIDITSGGTCTGSFSVAWSYIRDGETYLAPGVLDVYPKPNTYSAIHKLGSTAFV